MPPISFQPIVVNGVDRCQMMKLADCLSDFRVVWCWDGDNVSIPSSGIRYVKGKWKVFDMVIRNHVSEEAELQRVSGDIRTQHQIRGFARKICIKPFRLDYNITHLYVWVKPGYASL